MYKRKIGDFCCIVVLKNIYTKKNMLDLYRIMSTSRNFTELQTIWKGWRDVSGKKMKEKYAEFVELSNQGIKELDLGTCDFLLKT